MNSASIISKAVAKTRCSICGNDIPKDEIYLEVWDKDSQHLHTHTDCAKNKGCRFEPDRPSTAPLAQRQDDNDLYAVYRDVTHGGTREIFSIYKNDYWLGDCRHRESANDIIRIEQQLQCLPSKNKKKRQQTEGEKPYNSNSGTNPLRKENIMPATAAPKKSSKGTKSKETKPKAPKVGATEQELQAAIAGNLRPRETKGSKDQDSLGLVGEDGKPVGRPIGVTTGLPILLAWCYIFAKNEKAQKNDKMTDEQLSAWIKKEFPGREAKAFDHISGVRMNYNSGRFTKGTIPKVISHRYDGDGNVVEGRSKNGTVKPAAAKPAARGGKPKSKPRPPIRTVEA